MATLELPISGMTCQNCVQSLTAALRAVPGVEQVDVTLSPARARLELDAAVASREACEQAVVQAGFRVGLPRPAPTELFQLGAPPVDEPPPAAQQVLLDVGGMHCASCVAHVERALAAVPGVSAARANLASHQAVVEWSEEPPEPALLADAVGRAGYSARVATGESTLADLRSRSSHESRYWLRRVVIAAVLLAGLLAIAWGGFGSSHAVAMVQLLLASAMQFYVGGPFLVGALRRARRLSANMDTLVAIGTTTAYVAGIAGLLAGRSSPALHGGFLDAGMIVAFIALGRYLEVRTKGRASQAIVGLLDLTPPTARVVCGRQQRELPLNEVAVGQTIVIRPGDRVPLDAEVLTGQSDVDQAWITGESTPIVKRPGDALLAGTVNGPAALTVRVVRPAGNSAVARIVRLVQQAQQSKAEVQRLADRVVGWFVPAVIGVATVTLLGWWLLGGQPALAVRCAVAVLVVACPCALGLATPTAIMVAGGRGAADGILIKQAHALETAGRITAVVLDKTGTLTLGRHRVVDVLPAAEEDDNRWLALAAAAERLSGHPLAEAVVAHARRLDLEIPLAGALETIPGEGIRAQVDGHVVLVGNRRLMQSHGVQLPAVEPNESAEGWTSLRVAVDGVCRGVIRLADTVAPHSRQAVEQLHDLGLRVVMLSGDRQATAERIAEQVGIDRIVAEVRPEQKQQTIDALRSQGHVVAMVGDGINDAPALAAADLGIAIGAGADVAIETAEVVLTRHDLRCVAGAVQLARATLRTIKQNLMWALLYNTLLIPVAAGVLILLGGPALPPAAAAAAMSLSSVSVVANSVLLGVRYRALS